jgi:pimeloyl-ACP methyl ester carboxylesterase
VQRWNDIYFDLILPSGPAPAGGWPVVIFGHGSGGAKDAFALSVAATMAEQGIATVAINAVGHGFGSAGTLTVSLASGTSVTFTSGGRGIDQNGDGIIGPQEGIEAAAPRTVQHDRDGLRQTVADLMQLVGVIEAGVDVDGDGTRELDPARIYYAGHSLGGMYGAQLFAVDERVAAAVLNVPVALQAIRGNFSPVFRPSRGTWLAQRIPSLINSPGLTEIGGVPVGTPRYNENLPLRNEAPRVNDVAGAMAIQSAFENIEWAAMSGDAMAYMPHLRKTPLAGVRTRPILIQFAKSDQNVPNPITSMMLRASGLTDVTTLYRHDLAFGENSALPKNGHGFMPATATPAFRKIAIGAQRQIATFFASGGTTIIHPEPQRFFEVPVRLPLTEEFNYIR